MQFFDREGMQLRFVDLAEDAYTRLTRADAWTTTATIEVVQTQVVSTPRGLLRRTREVATSCVPVAVSLPIAEAHRSATEGPAAVNALPGCLPGRRLATLLGEILSELVTEVAILAPPVQKSHPDYRQLMRLTAELTAFAQVTSTLGCRVPAGCVVLRPPLPGGRRTEDAEITKFRALLLRRAKTSVG